MNHNMLEAQALCQ